MTWRNIIIFMCDKFEFTVSDNFHFERRGLVLAPFFRLDRFRFDGRERIRVKRPDEVLSEWEAIIEIPHVRPRPKVP